MTANTISHSASLNKFDLDYLFKLWGCIFYHRSQSHFPSHQQILPAHSPLCHSPKTLSAISCPHRRFTRTHLSHSQKNGLRRQFFSRCPTLCPAPACYSDKICPRINTGTERVSSHIREIGCFKISHHTDSPGLLIIFTRASPLSSTNFH